MDRYFSCRRPDNHENRHIELHLTIPKPFVHQNGVKKANDQPIAHKPLENCHLQNFAPPRRLAAIQ